MDDNIYRQSTEYFLAEPTEQVVERNEERDQVLSNAPQIQSAIDSLRSAAEFYESVKSIPDAVLTNPTEFMHVVAANKLAAERLRKEASKLDSTLGEFTEE